MAKRIRGILKNPGRLGAANYGYRNPWDTGRAAYKKRMQRVTGINRPSE